MIPRVAQSGRSFKGAALYYLHDKKAKTSDRVAWSETLNLPTDDPDRAVAHMIDTATHADELKAAAGLKAGRKLQKPVYSYSLAWSPDQSPTMAEQMEAARETLTVLGLKDHQALIVAHNDTDHPHVHVIVNRVDPETGKAAVMSNDQLKLSKWAEDYERRHGKILVEERVKNNADRAKGEWVKHQAEKRQEWQEWKKATTGKMWDDFKAEMKKAQKKRKPQYEALWQQRENRMAARKAEIKALFKPKWREKFQQQRKELANFDAGVFDRIEFALSRRDRSVTLGILEAIIAPSGLRHEFIQKQEEDRRSLAFAQGLAVRDASKEVHKAWMYDRSQLTAMHKAEDDKRHKDTKEATQRVWKQKPPANELGAKPSPEAAKKEPNILDLVKKRFSSDEIKKSKEESRKRRKRERKRNDGSRKMTPD